MRRGALLYLLLTACGGGLGGGTDWVNKPLVEEEGSGGPSSGQYQSGQGSSGGGRPQSRTLGQNAPKDPKTSAGGGRVLGQFRNTYYDFPREADHQGELVDVMSASCQSIAKVPRGFHDAVCVQGSGSLKRGGTISFAKRDCECAQICPRTNQKICFDALDPVAFPWGRGAAGKPIAPLRTIAADTSVLPLGTVVYLPELDGAG